MRRAFVSLLLATALGASAQAQVPSTEAGAPAAAAPAAEAAPVTAQPAAPAAAEAAPAQPVVEAPPPPPTLPTTGDGAVLVNVIETICVPLVRGGELEKLAKAHGMKKNRRDNSWSMGLGGDRNYTITVFAPGSNKDVCRGEIHYAIDQTDPIVKTLNIWSFLHEPELVLQANYVNVYGDGIKRVQRSWEHLEANSSQAVNFTTMTNADDTPLSKKYSAAEFYYQERTF